MTRLARWCRALLDGLLTISLSPPTHYRGRRVPLTPEEAWKADREALQGDWARVAEDLRVAFEKERADMSEPSREGRRER